MTDVLGYGKKAFTWAVVVTTILWSMGISALVPLVANAAECPTLQAGDRFKVKGNPAVYLLNADMKRMYFPNQEVYFSWFKDFNGITFIDQTCVSAYPNAVVPGVNYRSGSRLVKVVISPDVYAVEPGNVRVKIGSEAVAAALYGSNWAKLVRDIHDFHWPNYVDGTPLTEAKPHNGMLVKKASSSDVYVVKMGKLYKVDGALSTVASGDVRTVSDSVFGSLTMEATTVTAASVLDNPAQSSTTPSGPQPVSGSVQVALAANQNTDTTIISDSTANEYPQGHIPFVTVNFTAGNDKDVKVTKVNFMREGIANDSDIGNLYLYDGDVKLAEYTSFNDKKASFDNSSGLFTVAKGTTKAVTLRGDLARGSTSVASGKTYAFSVMAAGDVMADANVAGTFPIKGISKSTTAVSDLGHVYLSSYTTYPATIKADEANKELWRFTATADAQDMEIRDLLLTLVGTVAVSDIQNLRLEVAGVQVGTVQQLASDKTVRFNLSASPIKINAGQSKIVVLRGDMKGGSGRVFKFTIQRQTDIMIFDTDYGVYVPVAKDAVTTAFAVIQPVSGNGTSVDSGTLTIGVASDSPTGNIADAGTNLTLAKFSFAAVGEAVKVESLGVSCNGSDTSDVLANVKVLLDGTQIGSTVSTMTCSYSTSTYSFGNTFVVPAGGTKNVTVVADTTNSTVAVDATLTVNLAVGSSNAVGQSTLTSISTTAQSGRTLTVKGGTATAVKNTAFSDRSSTNPSGTLNATAVKIASFLITAGSGEAIDVTQIALADDSTSQLGDNFQNLKIMNGSTQIGATISSLNTTAGSYTFTPSSAIRIAAGQQYVVDAYADIKSSVADSATVLTPVVQFDSVTATGVNTSADASYTTNVNLQNAYIAATGNLTIALDSDNPDAKQVVMGSTGNEVARFKLTADAAEDLIITDLTISASVSSSATGTFKNLKLYVDGTQVGQAVNFGSTATTTFANADFAGLTLTIPRNSNKVLVVKADITTFDDGATSAGVHKFALLIDKGSGSNSVTVKGNSSGTTLSGGTLDYTSSPDVDVDGNSITPYRTKISVAYASDSPSGASVGGDDAVVAKINITNTANVGNYAANIESLNFAISQTGVSAASGSSRQVKVYKDSISSGNLLVTTQFVNNQNITNTEITDAGFTDVEVAAGTSKLFIVTLDSQDAGSDDKISINVDQGDVEWGDGSSTSVTDVNGLPLTPRTLTY